MSDNDFHGDDRGDARSDAHSEYARVEVRNMLV